MSTKDHVALRHERQKEWRKIRKIAKDGDTPAIMAVSNAHAMSRLIRELEGSFSWSCTAEGYEFWEYVSDRLRQIKEYAEDD